MKPIRNLTLTVRVTLCLALLAWAGPAAAAIYYVDATAGSDANPGTSQLPFATIQQAVGAANDAVSPGPDTIAVRPGNFVENVSIAGSAALTVIGTANTIVTAADSGENVIEIEDGDVTLRNLVVTGGRTGVEAASQSATLVDVSALSNSRNGVHGDGCTAITVTRGHFAGNGRDGIELDKVETTSLAHINATGNGRRGLDANSCGTVTIGGGQFADNFSDGIQVSESDAVSITAAQVVNNGTDPEDVNDGIDLEEVGQIELNNLTVTGNGDEGLEVDDSGAIIVNGGQYSRNGDEGLDIDNTATVALVNVNSRFNGGNGMQVEADATAVQVTITQSVFANNDGNGIEVVDGDDGSVDSLTLNTVASVQNGGSGLNIQISTAPLFIKVVSQANGAGDVVP